jgi:hypothetical protein
MFIYVPPGSGPSINAIDCKHCPRSIPGLFSMLFCTANGRRSIFNAFLYRKRSRLAFFFEWEIFSIKRLHPILRPPWSVSALARESTVFVFSAYFLDLLAFSAVIAYY